VRLSPPSVRQTQQPAAPAPNADRRLPPVGTVITRSYKGLDLRVRVVPQGIEYQGQVFASLTAVAKAITGTHTNGFFFFRLGQYQRSQP
jgi:hypothetical protein